MEKHKYSILIIDDYHTNIAALKKILSPMYVIYTADNGLDGLKAAEKYLPDLILLDICMPEPDGYEVITRLKNTEKTADIPVVFVTSLDGDEDEEEGFVLGAADYITKPFRKQGVSVRVQNQIMLIEQARLIKRLSMSDPVTDLPNRRAFEERMLLEWRRARRDNLPVSLIIVELSGFKDFVVNCGRTQGDAALKTVAGILEQSIKRYTDFAARRGSEDFAVLLPNTDSAGALDVAREIRSHIEKLGFPSLDKKDEVVRIRTNIGINSRTPTDECSIDEFILTADTRLDKTKSDENSRVYSE